MHATIQSTYIITERSAARIRMVCSCRIITLFMIQSFSHFDDLEVLVDLCCLATLYNSTDFPSFQPCLLHLPNKSVSFGRIERHQQPTTRLCSKSLEQFVCSDFSGFQFVDVLQYWELIDYELDVVLLGLGEVVGVTQYPEPSYISTGVGLVFPEKSPTNEIQRRHIGLCSVESVQYGRFGQHSQHFLPFLLIGLEPLHGIDGQPHPQRFGQHQHIPDLRPIGPPKLPLLNHSNRTPAQHRPHIKHTLASPHLDSRLLRRINIPLNHQTRRHILFFLRHLRRNTQNHQHLLYLIDAHCVQIREDIAQGDPTEHVGGFVEGVEEVQGRHEGVGADFAGRDVGGVHADGGRDTLQVVEQFVLGDLAASPFHLCVVRQHEVLLQAVFPREERLDGRGLPRRCPIQGSGKQHQKIQKVFNPGIEPGTVCVLDRRDNHYTN